MPKTLKSPVFELKQEEIYFSQCNQYQSKEKKLNGTQSGLQTQQDDETKKNT
jgi:hypothetical protein